MSFVVIVLLSNIFRLRQICHANRQNIYYCWDRFGCREGCARHSPLKCGGCEFSSTYSSVVCLLDVALKLNIILVVFLYYLVEVNFNITIRKLECCRVGRKL
jgi:hypothetical protein